MTDNNLITVAEVGQYAPEIDTSQYSAPTISGMISQASKVVSDYLMFTPFAEDIVNEVKQARITTEGDLLIFPEKLPIATISAIAITKGTTTAALSLTDGAGNARYNIDYTRRHIRFAFVDMIFSNTPVLINPYDLRYNTFYVKMSYRGGWEVASLPAVIKQATLLILRDIFANQNNPMGANSIRQGSLSFSYSSGFGAGQTESKFIKDAKRLLNPYRRIG